MTTQIGRHYGTSEANRFVPVAVGDYRFEVLANRFEDTWTVSQELPDLVAAESSDELCEVYEDTLREIEALQLLGYELSDCDDATAFWSKPVDE